MARWRLTEDHYLKVPGTYWEQVEVNTITGKQGRKRFDVPLYVEKETIVAYAGSEQKDDIVFEGEPTPAMEPVDDEAQKISDELKDKWINPIESLPNTLDAIPQVRAPKAAAGRRAV